MTEPIDTAALRAVCDLSDARSSLLGFDYRMELSPDARAAMRACCDEIDRLRALVDKCGRKIISQFGEEGERL